MALASVGLVACGGRPTAASHSRASGHGQDETTKQSTAPLSPPQTTSPIPPCTAANLFAAAVAKEHFNPDGPGYSEPGAESSGAVYVACIGDWALASILRPFVGITDGDTLFEVQWGAWVEITKLDFPLNSEQLTQDGVPQSTATSLLTDQHNQVPL